MNYTFEDVEAIRRAAQEELEGELQRWGFSQELQPVERYHVMAVLRAHERLAGSLRPFATRYEITPGGAEALEQAATRPGPAAPAPEPEPEPEPEDGTDDLPTGVTSLPPGPEPEPEPEPLSLPKPPARPGPRPQGRAARPVQRAEQAIEAIAGLLEGRPGVWVSAKELLQAGWGRPANSKERRQAEEGLRRRYRDRFRARKGKGPTGLVQWRIDEEPAAAPAGPANPKRPSSAPGQALEGGVLELRPQPQTRPQTPEPAPPAVERLPEGGFIRPVEPDPKIKAMLERMAAGRASAAERARLVLTPGFRREFKKSRPRTPSRLTELAQKLFADLGYDRPGESFAEGSTGHQDWLRCLEKARKAMQSESEMAP